MNTGMLFAALVAIAVGVSLVAWWWRRGGRRSRIVIVTMMLLVVAAIPTAVWLAISGPTQGVWVDSLGAVDGHVEFSAPWASGGANGNSYHFTSSADTDDVFAAFSDAYPGAVRDGNASVVVIGDHTFTLTYHPEGSEDTGKPYWILANDRA